MKKNIIRLMIALCLVSSVSCTEDDATNSTDTSQQTPLVKAPSFNADSAYSFVQQQVNFGPRVPGTASQKNCAAWMQAQLKKYCDSVYVQDITVTQPIAGKTFPCINIIGEINPAAASRVLLLCHWDSRGFADEDADKKNHTKPIDAADDGASGVAVLIEIARAIKAQKLDIGVDILLADVEDYGTSEMDGLAAQRGLPSTYCLGTRYWAQNLHKFGYRANFGICLDMVGAKGATFLLEQNSKQLAGDFQQKVWTIASKLGYSNYFLFQNGGAITDDHMEVNQYARIPTIDIINTTTNGGFAPHWHTVNDNISVIEKGTLKAVGETVLGVLYNY
jgi:glutaminyl-peptide cyclotransferase